MSEELNLETQSDSAAVEPSKEAAENKIDSFGDVAARASEVTAKVTEAAKSATGQVGQGAKAAASQASQTARSAAEQVSQSAKTAVSRTSEAAKRAKDAAKTAGAQAAAKAEQNQERAEAQAQVQVAEEPQTSKQIISKAWSEYLFGHKATLLYGLLGLIVGLCILWFGFWPVLLVVVCTYLGSLYGRYRDGDATIVTFLRNRFSDDD